MSKFAQGVLLVIDVQKAIDASYHAAEGPRNNPDAEGKIAQLLSAWRREGRPIIHIRHDSTFAVPCAFLSVVSAAQRAPVLSSNAAGTNIAAAADFKVRRQLILGIVLGSGSLQKCSARLSLAR